MQDTDYTAKIVRWLSQGDERDRWKLITWQRCRAPALGSGLSPAESRYDAFGNEIRWAEYGNQDSPYGWHLDHIIPLAVGGRDEIDNIRALHWQPNCKMGGLLSAVLGSRQRANELASLLIRNHRSSGHADDTLASGRRS